MDLDSKNPRRFASLIAFFVLTVSSCNFTSSNEVELERNVESIGTNGQLISIHSDNVRSAGYDVNSKIMTVQFNNGYTYEYYGVPPELWNQFIAAQPHPWSQVGYPQLVQAGVPYKRIG